MRKNRKTALFAVLSLLIIGGIILSLPPVWSRVSYYADQIYTAIFYKLNPPQAVVFSPGQSTPDDVATSVQATMQAMLPQTTPTPQLIPESSPTPTATLLPLPPSVYLQGVQQEAQSMNNCGPATLSMNLSYWGWDKNQEDAAAILKPNKDDKNVMPYEIVDYVNQNTQYKALSRMGGDLYTLKALVNAGFPVLLEKGYDPLDRASNELGWMGHYNLLIGYDDSKSAFITQDSYLLALMPSEQRSQTHGFDVTYDDIIKNWRAFNYVFIVVYPTDYENDVLNLLGPLANEINSYHVANDRATVETQSLTDPREQFFAWFNIGTSLVKLADYSGAASAFDTAFSVYPSVVEIKRPWRMLWYQTGPYFAYYYSSRYQDVINLANTTLNTMKSPILEESYHWRALAKEALGDRAGAIADLRNAVSVHPGFPPSVEQLIAFGEAP